MSRPGKNKESGLEGERPRLFLGRRLFRVPTLLPLAVVIIVVALLVTRFDLDWGRTWEVLRHSNAWWLVLAVLAHYTTFIFRGARWRLLLANAGRGVGPSRPVPSTLHCGGLILMGWFVNSVTWFRLGDAYRAHAYSSDTGTGFARTMGTVVADRVVDVAVVFSMMTAAVVTLYVGGQVRPSPIFVAIGAVLLAAGLSGLVAMYLLRRWVAHRLPERVEAAYQRFHAGTMGSFGRLHLVFLLGVLGWLSEVGRLFLVLKALGIPMALGLVIFVPLASGLLSAVPLTPGGLGVVEAGVTGLLVLSIAYEEALAVALLDRSISYLSIVIIGGMAFALRQARTARKPSGGPGRSGSVGAGPLASTPASARRGGSTLQREREADTRRS